MLMQALRVAPRDVDVMGKNLVATLYVNRAAVLQKMGLYLESLRDCNRALAICRSYSKAWYRRGKANTSMGNYNDAVCDLKVSLCMEHSLSGKRQIEAELKLILSQNNREDFPPNGIKCKESDIHDQLQDIQLQCVETETKGRGMVSLTDIPQATLLHAEEPYAAIVSKNCRETHCHFCFNELPADIVPCSSCSMALYCSQLCQIHARGQDQQFHTKNHDIGFDLSGDLENYVTSVTEAIDDGVNIKQNAEHKHECGVNWPAALPAEIVLAGRAIVKSIEQNRHFNESSSIVNLELCQNYLQLGTEAKLELHISSIVLMKCLHHCYRSDIPLNGDTLSQVGQWSCNKRRSSLKEQYAFVFLDSSVANYEQQKINPFSCVLTLQVGRFKHDEVKKVASFLCKETGSTHQIKPGFCLSCGAFRDLEASNAVVKKAEICIGRLEGLLDSGECHNTALSNALRSLDLLKSALHPYNKKVAEAEDYIAQAFCLIGELQRSRDHCQASIKILEKLYGDDHSVIGNEMVKLASIQLSLGDHAVEETRNRISLIFSQHYGSQVDAVFPHLQFLKRSV
ncbi:hypothetical protein M8C21_005859 [Ambrosia artemisiifolia]|uniref:Uncharacterized protein n=1 Tax=Ambrosia artemisiifolia TaxID=4212 RepID=A0AAD5BRE1_AMBAR|nr:hypothetical protein M8C21_005859 [Ambrosia artemisiifolia]